MLIYIHEYSSPVCSKFKFILCVCYLSKVWFSRTFSFHTWVLHEVNTFFKFRTLTIILLLEKIFVNNLELYILIVLWLFLAFNNVTLFSFFVFIYLRKILIKCSCFSSNKSWWFLHFCAIRTRLISRFCHVTCTWRVVDMSNIRDRI